MASCEVQQTHQWDIPTFSGPLEYLTNNRKVIEETFGILSKAEREMSRLQAFA